MAVRLKTRSAVWAAVVLAIAGTTAGLSWWRASAQADVLRADPDAILRDPRLRSVALTNGKRVFDKHCAACHGPDGRGDITLGASDLTDSDTLYGTGSVAQIEEIARYGIRAGNKHGWNLAVMPAYASKVPDAAEALPPQSPAQIEDLTQYLLSFTGRTTDVSAMKRGITAYTKAGCWDCHGRDLGGDPAIGAPNLTDTVWLYGGRPEDIRRTLQRGRAGKSPAFARVLTAAELRNVAVYTASLAHPRQETK
ncbi:c-type cytochrome [Novosphingobium sp.]|uniref:c-type cytochrome n=1 Tax=Novosphingobium sp. TaxID=1874826 RepID=UPI0038BB3B68